MDNVTENELMDTLVATIAQLGWTVALPELNDDDPVPGMIIGTNEYVGSIIDNLPDNMFND